ARPRAVPPGHTPRPARQGNRGGTASDLYSAPLPTPVGRALHRWPRPPAWPAPTPVGSVLARRGAQSLAPSPGPSPPRRMPAWPPRLDGAGKVGWQSVGPAADWAYAPPAGPAPALPDSTAAPGRHSPITTRPPRHRSRVSLQTHSPEGRGESRAARC